MAVKRAAAHLAAENDPELAVSSCRRCRTATTSLHVMHSSVALLICTGSSLRPCSSLMWCGLIIGTG